MVCYAISVIAAILCFGWRKGGNIKDPRYLWLNQMLAGSAIFGVVDHAWNGELFLIGANIMSDLALGTVIVLSIVAFWGIMVYTPKLSPAAAKA